MNLETSTIQIGDTVVLTESYPYDNPHLHAGDVGVVTGFFMQNPEWLNVDWGRDIGGHSCGGTGVEGNGWTCASYMLEKKDEDLDLEINMCSEEELINFLYA